MHWPCIRAGTRRRRGREGLVAPNQPARGAVWVAHGIQAGDRGMACQPREAGGAACGVEDRREMNVGGPGQHGPVTYRTGPANGATVDLGYEAGRAGGGRRVGEGGGLHGDA